MKNHINLKTGKVFPRGLRPTSRAKLAAATPYKPKATPPASFGNFPASMNMLGNDNDGDCVTAEEGFNKQCAGINISYETAVAWAQANGVLNGADLEPVIQQMQAQGMAQDGNIYGDGAPSSVNYADWASLTAAIYEAGTQANSGPGNKFGGCVKCGVAADELPSGAGNQNGWLMLTNSPDQNEDHCMGACAYGTLAQCVAMMNAAYPGLGLAVPSGADPTTPCVCMYTWSTIGIVSFTAFTNFVGEVWLRSPSSVSTGTGAVTVDPVYSTAGPTPPPSPTPGGTTTVLLTDPAGSGVTATVTYPTPAIPTPVATTYALEEDATGVITLTPVSKKK